MRLAVSSLCDAASVRENLLSILSAGLTTTRVPEFPAPLQMVLVVQLQLESDEFGSLPVDIAVRRDGDDTDYLRIQGEITVGHVVDENFDPWEPLLVPITFPLAGALLPTEGNYAVTAQIGTLDPFELRFTARLSATG